VTATWERGVRDFARLAALERSGLVGTGPEDVFDRLLELAVKLIGIRTGCITLVDEHRTTAKCSVGFPEGLPLYLPIEQSFCRHVVGSGRPLVVDDARIDPRTIGDPAVELYAAVAWAGYPIHDIDGAVLGTFCLMDCAPHEWSAIDIDIVATLAAAASSEIALRRSRSEAIALRQEVKALRRALMAHPEQMEPGSEG
jgi:sigma-B regulation protein RsbU (phosphoserine phosphatase)